MLSVHDLFEAAHGIFQLDVFAWSAGELLRNVERLRKEPLNTAGPRDGLLVLIAQLVDTENRDDVLKVLVALQRLLNALSHFIMLRTHNVWIENTGGRSKRIHCGIDTEFRDCARQVGGGVQV